MRRLLLIFALLLPSLGWAGTCGNGYSYHVKLNLIKVPNGGADVSNWVYSIPNLGGDPVNKELLNGALKDAAHGGQVQNSATNGANELGPADFILCDAASGGNVIPFEVASWDNVNGIAELYFLQALWHYATNDGIHLFANNSSVTTTQQDAGLGTNSNFWSTAGYLEVCHFGTSSSLNIKCALSVGTEANGGATATTGQIGGAANFVASSSQYIDLGAPINRAGTTISIETWLKIGTYGGAQNLVRAYDGSNGYTFQVGRGSGCGPASNGGLAFFADASSSFTYHCILNDSYISTGVWTYQVLTWTGTNSSNMNTYQNGALTTGSIFNFGTGSMGNSTVNVRLGYGPPTDNYYTGALDELRIRAAVDDAAWVANNWWLQSPHLAPIAGYPSGSDHMTYQVAPTSYPAAATAAQFASCYATSSTFTCPMPFPKQAGTMLAPAVAGINDAITGVSDSLGLTYTHQVNSTFHGTLTYTTDIYTTPASATSGDDTFTLACSGCGGNDISAVIWEVSNGTTSGLVTTNSNLSPPGAQSLINPSNGSFLICNIQNSSFGPVVTTEGYTQVATLPSNYPAQGTPASNNTSPYAVNVAAGTQTCTANTVGSGATMIVIPYAPATSSTVKHRVIRH